MPGYFFFDYYQAARQVGQFTAEARKIANGFRLHQIDSYPAGGSVRYAAIFEQRAGPPYAAFHGLFIHYIVGLWITPAGYVLIYYYLPVSARNPLFSHKLSLIGFWSLAPPERPTSDTMVAPPLATVSSNGQSSSRTKCSARALISLARSGSRE